MTFLEIILILAAIIAAFVILGIVIYKISAYYRQNYDFSVWSGVFLLLIAMAFVVVPLNHDGNSIVPLIIGGLIFLFTVIQDLRLAGIGMGILAMLFQMIMAILFIAILIVAVIRWFFSLVTGPRVIYRGGESGLSELMYGLILLPVFLKVF